LFIQFFTLTSLNSAAQNFWNVGYEWVYQAINNDTNEFHNITNTVISIKNYKNYTCYVIQSIADNNFTLKQNTWINLDMKVLKEEVYDHDILTYMLEYVNGYQPLKLTLSIGDKWSSTTSWIMNSSFTETNGTLEAHYQVIKKDTIKVPAGVFNTYLIEGYLNMTESNSYYTIIYIYKDWFSFDIRNYVKRIENMTFISKTSNFTSITTMQLIKYNIGQTTTTSLTTSLSTTSLTTSTSSTTTLPTYTSSTTSISSITTSTSSIPTTSSTTTSKTVTFTTSQQSSFTISKTTSSSQFTTQFTNPEFTTIKQNDSLRNITSNYLLIGGIAAASLGTVFFLYKRKRKAQIPYQPSYPPQLPPSGQMQQPPPPEQQHSKPSLPQPMHQPKTYPLTKVCSNCGTNMPYYAKFCPKCGAPQTQS
jgi:hypothetical protein